MLSLKRLGIVAFVLPLVGADVTFIKPRPGDNVTGSSLMATWKESGISPAISTFSSYQLFLCAGGINGTDFVPLFDLQPYASFSNGNQWTGAISTQWGGNVENAYFLKMICTSACGGQIINYSSRFTISSMTGAFPKDVLDGLADAGNTTSGPGTDSSGAGAAASSCTASIAGPTSTAYPTSTSVLSPSSSASSSPSTSNPPPSPKGSVTLSPGTLAGTIVGAILTFASILALVALCTFVRRRKKRENGSMTPHSPISTLKFWSGRNKTISRLDSNSGTSVSELSNSVVCKEMEADKRHPVESGGSPLTELPARHSVYEMPAS